MENEQADAEWSKLSRKTNREDQIIMCERGQGKKHFPCSADHVEDWKFYPVDPYSAINDGHKYFQIGVWIRLRVRLTSYR